MNVAFFGRKSSKFVDFWDQMSTRAWREASFLDMAGKLAEPAGAGAVGTSAVVSAGDGSPSKAGTSRIKKRELADLEMKAQGNYWSSDAGSDAKRSRARRTSANEIPQGAQVDESFTNAPAPVKKSKGKMAAAGDVSDATAKKPPATPVQCSPNSDGKSIASTVKSSPAAEDIHFRDVGASSSLVLLEPVAKGGGGGEAIALTSVVQQGSESEWRKEGSDYVGCRALRTMLDDNGNPVAAFGTIVGWLSAEESDFVSEETGKPAALWHMVYNDTGVGEEDLEEYEVKEALVAACLAEANRLREAARRRNKKKQAGKSGRDSNESSDNDPIAALASLNARGMGFHRTQGVQRVVDVASERGVDAHVLLALNAGHISGLQMHAKLKPGTLLLIPPIVADSAPKDVGLRAAAEAAVGVAAAKTTAPDSPAKAAAVGEPVSPAKNVGEASALESPPRGEHEGMWAKAVLWSRPSGLQNVPADYHHRLMPRLRFPAFPMVTESDGLTPELAQRFKVPFQCPFERRQGITYATAGYEAVAPITAKVEDNWAACDKCGKWRRLPETFLITEDAEFFCAMAGVGCGEHRDEDGWDEDEEMEIANDTQKALTAVLPLSLEGDALVIRKLGEVMVKDNNYWNDRYIYPLGFESTRLFASPEYPDGPKVPYLCQIQADADGPKFVVTPLDAAGEPIAAQSHTGPKPSDPWNAVYREIARARRARTSSRDAGAGLEQRPAGAGAIPVSTDMDMAPADTLGLDDSLDDGEVAAAPSGSRGSTVFRDEAPMEGDGEQLQTHTEPVAEGAGGERWQGADGEREGGAQRGPNGWTMFGLRHEQVQQLIRELPDAGEIVEWQREFRRRADARAATLRDGPRPVSERMASMPGHLHGQKNARVPVRNILDGRLRIGESAPRSKDIRKFLAENTAFECVDPAKLVRADLAALEDSCEIHVCWECKKGMFAARKNTKIQCRIELGHSGPDWKKDQRNKDNDPLAHVRHPSSFKVQWKEGRILKLDYNKNDEPFLLKVPQKFIEEALQVSVSWDNVLDEFGTPMQHIHLEKVDPTSFRNDSLRAPFIRPSWPPVPPENAGGCARATPWTRRSFTEKAEFTQMAREHFERLVSPSEYASMTDAIRFEWMKTHQKERLVIGPSGIEGFGIFARRPIYAGEMVVEYTGEAIRPVLADVREERYEAAGIGTYFWRLEDYLGAGEPLEGRAAIVDATVRHNIGHFINHCCDPNCEAKITRIDGRKRIVIFAKYNIEFGEELSYDYKLPYEEKKIKCLCGSAKCRGTLN